MVLKAPYKWIFVIEPKIRFHPKIIKDLFANAIFGSVFSSFLGSSNYYFNILPKLELREIFLSFILPILKLIKFESDTENLNKDELYYLFDS
jgi:hypothetical protein